MGRMPNFAVIFDMDGVLIDSYHAHFVGWSRLYEELKLPYSESEFALDFGRTSRDILYRRFGEGLTDDRIRELDERKEALFRDSLHEHFPAMDGALDLIDALAANDIPLAVGSSGPPENISLCLEKLGRRENFAAIVTGSDVTRGKPDPQVFQLAASRLGVDPDRCVVVEDATHGVEAANRAGMRSVALVGTTTRDSLSAAHLIVDSLRELTPATFRSLVSNGS
jgi:beta-phosphoglucomutase